jgi:hypothetical protein
MEGAHALDELDHDARGFSGFFLSHQTGTDGLR